MNENQVPQIDELVFEKVITVLRTMRMETLELRRQVAELNNVKNQLLKRLEAGAATETEGDDA